MKGSIERIKALILADTGKDEREWAASTSDEKMIYALATPTNKKHYKKLSHE